MWQKQPGTKFWGSCSAQSTWLAWPDQLAAKVRVRFMVMVWLEGGRGEPVPPPPPPSPLAPTVRGLAGPPAAPSDHWYGGLRGSLRDSEASKP